MPAVKRDDPAPRPVGQSARQQDWMSASDGSLDRVCGRSVERSRKATQASPALSLDREVRSFRSTSGVACRRELCSQATPTR